MEKIIVKSWGPTFTKAGNKFNVQTNGTSSLWFKVEKATSDMGVVLNNRFLGTAFKTPDLLTATVDNDIVLSCGKYVVYVLDAMTGAESAKVIFDVV